ncbi:MAG: AAA family ATPase [Dermatophilaceae bacterium]
MSQTLAETTTRCQEVLDEVARVIVGKRDASRLVLLGILSSGHVLIEDVPGVGKTLLARSLATVLGLEFTRVQFTPDLLPSDLTGVSIYNQASGEFTFRPGPVFTNLLLADEINHTPPKTQAALLEAMAERQVSADGQTSALPDPFVVLATDNPIEYEGTYPLPEAQLDRFTLRVRLGYLTPAGEADMVRRRIARGTPEPAAVSQVIDIPELLRIRQAVERVEVADDVIDYATQIVAATRTHPQLALGASPRATLSLIQLARAAALLDGRTFTIPEDVKTLAAPALAHRLGLRPEVWARRVPAEDVVADVLSSVAVPRAGAAR